MNVDLRLQKQVYQIIIYRFYFTYNLKLYYILAFVDFHCLQVLRIEYNVLNMLVTYEKKKVALKPIIFILIKNQIQ